MSETTELIAQQIMNGNINKRTWGDILYNVKVYGAKGDWNTVTSTGTDDTASVQATIDAAIAVGGKAVFFPHGTYKVTTLTSLSSVVLFGDNATFVGISNTITQIGAPVTSGIVYNVKDYGAKGDGSTIDTTKISDALTAAVLGGIVFLPPGTYITDNLTVPANVTLCFANGAKLSINSGATVTINGAIDAAPCPIFSGAGTVNGSPKISTCYAEWFGAKKDGATDDSAAIKKAVNFFLHVTFMPGAYTIGAMITLNTGNYLNGQGATFYTTTGLTNAFYVPLTATQVHLYKMNVIGNSASAIAFKLDGDYVWVDECTTYNVATGINSRGPRHYISKCDIRATLAVFVELNFEVRTFCDSIFQGGIRITGGSGLRFSNNDILGGDYNMLVDPPAGVTVASIKITGCFFDQGTSGCLYLIPVGSVARTKISNSWFTGSVNGRGITTNANVTGLQISNCDIYGNKTDGILVNSGGTTVTGCNIAGNLGAGISVEVGATSFNITGNIIGPCGGYGGNVYPVYINAGASDVYVITGNILRGNTAVLFDGGSGTNKVIANNVV